MEAKFKVGDTVRCTNPTHPGENPFVVRYIFDNFQPKPNYYGNGSLENHDFGWIGCRESELELVKEGE